MAPVTGKNTGVIKKPRFPYLLECPGGIPLNSESRCPKPLYLFPDNIFQNRFPPADVSAKGIPPHGIWKEMPITVTGDLMPGIPAAADQSGVALGLPSQPENSSGDLVFRQNPEQDIKIGLNP